MQWQRVRNQTAANVCPVPLPGLRTVAFARLILCGWVKLLQGLANVDIGGHSLPVGACRTRGAVRFDPFLTDCRCNQHWKRGGLGGGTATCSPCRLEWSRV